ncbi:MAG: ABC transporter substrate-binding protein [Polyangiaceae bacterium]
MNRRLALSLVATLALSASLGCSSKEGSQGSGAAPGSTHVKLALNWVPEPEFGGFYQAREGKSFEKQGLDVEIQGGGAGVPVVQMVATGQADFGLSAADEVLTAKAHGADIVAVFATYQTSPQGIMARPERGATLADVFSTGTLAIEPGLSYSLFLKKKYGFDRVKIVPYDGGVARFAAEKDYAQQCFVTSEPLAAKKKGIEPKVFLVADEGFNPYAGVVIVKRSTWLEKRDLVKRFVTAAREGWQSYLADPAPANAVMARLNTSMDIATFNEVAATQKPFVETADTKARGLGTMTRERWDTLAKQLVDLGVLTQAPNVDDVLPKDL